jgi:hypothetical protein
MAPMHLAFGWARTAAALLLIGLLGACFTGLPEDAFPCAEDQTCTEGLSCVPDVGCVSDATSYAPYACPVSGICPEPLLCSGGQCREAGLDTVCGVGGTCGSTDLTCSVAFNLCSQPCDPANPCPDGRVCSRPAGGICFGDCTDGEECAAGQLCYDLYYEGRRGCITEGPGVNACIDIQSTGCDAAIDCTWGTCTAGQGCPINGTCELDGRCGCPAGTEAVTCDDGTPCTSTTCEALDYACRAIGSGALPGCFDDWGAASGTCTCVDGTTIPFSCGEAGKCHDACVARATGDAE